MTWFRWPFLRAIRFYQRFLSLDQGLLGRLIPHQPVCRFEPTCSEYSYQAIERFGLIKGGWLAFKRIIRCHPWGGFGPDPVPRQ